MALRRRSRRLYRERRRRDKGGCGVRVLRFCTPLPPQSSLVLFGLLPAAPDLKAPPPPRSEDERRSEDLLSLIGPSCLPSPLFRLRGLSAPLQSLELSSLPILPQLQTAEQSRAEQASPETRNDALHAPPAARRRRPARPTKTIHSTTFRALSQHFFPFGRFGCCSGGGKRRAEQNS